MAFTLLLISIGIIGLIIASITDIKKKEVPDWLSYSLIASGLSLRLIYSLKTSLWPFFLYGLLGFFAMFLIGNLMYYSKQWGGGDAKLLMAMGAIFATVPGKRFFLLNLGINILIVGAIYGILFSLILAFKHRDKFKFEFKRLLKKNRKNKVYMYVIFLAIIIGLLVFNNLSIRMILLSLGLAMLANLYLIIFVKAVENACMYKIIPISRLVEGDWVANDIKSRGKLIYSKKSYGINKKQIVALKKTGLKKVLIKDGFPFVPTFLIAAIITLLYNGLLQGILSSSV